VNWSARRSAGRRREFKKFSGRLSTVSQVADTSQPDPWRGPDADVGQMPAQQTRIGSGQGHRGRARPQPNPNPSVAPAPSAPPGGLARGSDFAVADACSSCRSRVR
jgi:hypothetical protein